MSKAKAITEKVMKTFEGMTTEKLLELWETTTDNNDKNIPTVRGWLMEAIEKRNPAAFDRWLDEDAEDENLRYYIMAQ